MFHKVKMDVYTDMVSVMHMGHAFLLGTDNRKQDMARL